MFIEHSVPKEVVSQSSTNVVPESNDSAGAQDSDRLAQTSTEFEAMFIAEMLRHAGFAKSLSAGARFGGEVFANMLIDTYAKTIAEKGDIGLSQILSGQLKGNKRDASTY